MKHIYFLLLVPNHIFLQSDRVRKHPFCTKKRLFIFVVRVGREKSRGRGGGNVNYFEIIFNSF